MFTLTFSASEAYSKPSNKCGTYEYLMNFAKRMLNESAGSVEIRDAYGTLRYYAATSEDGIQEWSSND